MAYATNSDLVALRVDILKHGVTDWTAQLALAEADVIERIKVEWFIEASKGMFAHGLSGQPMQTILDVFDITYLNTALLKNLICYRAMAWYIYPSLTKDTEDGEDAYSRRAVRYGDFYNDEWERVIKMPLYDFNADASFTALDRQPSSKRTVKVARA